jgi:hypothetical protein
MWFTINLVFEGVHIGRAEQESVWEERLLLVWADNEDQAQHLGETRARTNEYEYVSTTGERIHWQYRHVERVFPLDAATPECGTTVFSRFFRTAEIRSLLTPSQD